MGERKIINKYYQTDFDPPKIRRVKLLKNHQIKVRLGLPMSIQCNTCGTYISKGTKLKSLKEDVNETYLGIQICRFCFKCTKCSAELTIKTDPRNSDYVVESGAAQCYAPSQTTVGAVEFEKREKESEEMGDAVKALENRAQYSKQDMDRMACLEEMKSLMSRYAAVSIDDMIAMLHHMKQEKEQKMDKIDNADKVVTKPVLFPGHKLYKVYVKRVQDNKEEDKDDDEDDFSEKGKSRVGVLSTVEKQTDILSKTSIFNSSKDNKDGMNGPSIVKRKSDAQTAKTIVKHTVFLKRKSSVQPTKKLVAENNTPNSATDGIQADNELLSLCQKYERMSWS